MEKDIRCFDNIWLVRASFGHYVFFKFIYVEREIIVVTYSVDGDERLIMMMNSYIINCDVEYGYVYEYEKALYCVHVEYSMCCV